MSEITYKQKTTQYLLQKERRRSRLAGQAYGWQSARCSSPDGTAHIKVAPREHPPVSFCLGTPKHPSSPAPQLQAQSRPLPCSHHSAALNCGFSTFPFIKTCHWILLTDSWMTEKDLKKKKKICNQMISNGRVSSISKGWWILWQGLFSTYVEPHQIGTANCYSVALAYDFG